MISRRWLNFCCCCCCAVVVKKPIIEEHAFVPLAPFSLSNCSDHQELDSQEIKGIKKKERKTNKQTNKKKKKQNFFTPSNFLKVSLSSFLFFRPFSREAGSFPLLLPPSSSSPSNLSYSYSYSYYYFLWRNDERRGTKRTEKNPRGPIS